MRCRIAVGVCVALAGCGRSHFVSDDADGATDADGSPRDAGGPDDGGVPPLDAWIPCEPAGALVETDRVMVGGPEDQGVHLWRARSLSDGRAVALLRASWVGDELGGVRFLVLLERDGTLGDPLELQRDRDPFTAAVDVLEHEGELLIVGRNLESGQQVLWARTVQASAVSERVELHRSSGELGGPTLVAGTPPVLLYAEGGTLLRSEIQMHPLSLGPVTPLPVPVESRARLSANSNGSRTCVAITDLAASTSSLRLAELGDETTVRDVIDQAAFTPLPALLDGHCTLPYFAPDPTRPLWGEVRLLGLDDRLTGWRGTTPVGLALVPESRSVLLAARAPASADEIHYWWLRLDGACSTGAPLLAGGRAHTGTAQGVLATVELAGQSHVLVVGSGGVDVLSVHRMVE